MTTLLYHSFFGSLDQGNLDSLPQGLSQAVIEQLARQLSSEGSARERSTSQLSRMVGGRIQYLTNCYTQGFQFCLLVISYHNLVPCHLGLSIAQLKIWQLDSSEQTSEKDERAKGNRQTERGKPDRSQCFSLPNFRSDISLFWVIFYSL